MLAAERLDSQNWETTEHISETVEYPDRELFAFMENVEK